MSLWNFGRSADATSRALLLSEALRLGPNGLPTPSSPPFGVFLGIFGVGVMSYANVVSAVVLMDVKQVGKSLEPVPLMSVPSARNALEVLFKGDVERWATSVFALGITEPELQVSTSDDLLAPNLGTCGSHARWGNSQGLITAGHVASVVGSPAYSKASHIGRVVFSSHPANTGAQIGTDVALIELNPGVQLVATITGTALVQPLDGLEVLCRSGQRLQTQVMGKMDWITIPSVNGTLGNVYLTMQGITQKGDSGAAVLLSSATWLREAQGLLPSSRKSTTKCRLFAPAHISLLSQFSLGESRKA